MEQKLYFPVFVDLSDKKVVVVGGGTIATRRVCTLLPFVEELIVIAPEVTREIENLSREGRVHLYRRNYEKEDVKNVYLLVAATNVREINEEIGRDGTEAGCFVSVADHKEECTVLFPGIALKEDSGVVIGITASGRNHKLAKKLTEKIKRILKNLNMVTDK